MDAGSKWLNAMKIPPGASLFVRTDEKEKSFEFAILNAIRRMEKVRKVKLPVKASFSGIKVKHHRVGFRCFVRNNCFSPIHWNQGSEQ